MGGRKLCVLAVLMALCAACAPEWTARPDAKGTDHYVSLGDSWVSGPLIPNQVGTPIDCGRSDHNLATLLAQQLDVAAFTDASCGGGDIDSLTQPFKANLGGKAPPQFDSLRPDTTLVTLGVGGNDAGISDASIDCINLLPIPLGPPPFGTPCVQTLTKDGVDRLSARIAKARPKLAAALAAIHQISPKARVYVLGYGAAFPDNGSGCWPTVPLLPPDVDYLRARMLENNAMIADVTAAAGDHYVDLWSFSRGHDLCQPTGIAWINGATLDPPGFIGHPNELYHYYVAKYLTQLIGSDGH